MKAGGISNAKTDESLVNQRELDCDKPNKACTFSVFYMATLILSTCTDLLPMNDTVKNAKDGNPPAVGNNGTGMSVNNPEGISKAAGANDISVSGATYVGTNPNGGKAIDNSAASKDIINSLNNGELIHARVSPDPTNMGHSVLFTGYTVNPTTGKVVITVNDPDGGNQGKNRYNYYDPETND